MKYRLKDRELQKKLDDISGGDFSNTLKRAKVFPIPIAFRIGEDGPATCIQILEKDVEPYIEYDPSDWNPYPEVTPPEGVLMRVEYEDDGLNGKWPIVRKCAIFINGEWRDDVVAYPLASIKKGRFRPWE